MDNNQFKQILKKFNLDCEILKIKRLTNGHINETYKVSVLLNNKIAKYIIQKINIKLFKNYKDLMLNIFYITEHLKNKIVKRNQNPAIYTLDFLKTNENLNFIEYENNIYRAYKYVDNSTTVTLRNDPEIFYRSAKAFAQFAKDLQDFDVHKLKEIIPDFHNTIKRYEFFEKSCKNAEASKLRYARNEINFAVENNNIKDLIMPKLLEGKIPYRVTHNDTKINNVLFDNDTNEPLAVIDLDTVMPGSILFDFGDSIRFGCNTGKEDEINLDKVDFSFENYEAYIKGYLEILGDTLTNEELNLLYLSGIVLTYECGIRFLSDYLNGDIYFKTSRKGHNLQRARTQFKLVKIMLKNTEKLKKIVEKYAR